MTFYEYDYVCNAFTPFICYYRVPKTSTAIILVAEADPYHRQMTTDSVDQEF